MTDVLRRPGNDRRKTNQFHIWVSDYAQGRYVDVARAWSAARERQELSGFAQDMPAIEAVGWSLALAKQWDAYAGFRADLQGFVSRDGATDGHRHLLAVLDAWHAIHEARYDACLHAVRNARGALLEPGAPALTFAHALKVEGVALFRMGRYHEAEAMTRRALEVFQLAGAALDVSHCATNLGLILNARGEIRAARAELQRSLAALAAAGAAEERLALARVNLAVVELHLGQVDAARALFESTLETFARLDLRSERVTSLNGLGHCGRVRGDFAAAARHYRAALELATPDLERQTGLGHEFLGQLCFDQGHLRRAEAHYLVALEVAAHIAPDGDLMLEACWRHAELLAAAGRAGEAREFVRRAAALCEASQERRELGCVQRAGARVLAADGDAAEASLAFATAARTLDETGRTFEAGITRLAHGEFELRRGALAAALPLLESAQRIFAEFGATSPWVERAARLRRQADGSGAPAAGSPAPRACSGFWTRDPETSALLDSIRELARTEYPVLLEGESGTGKELLARAVHEAGGRSGPFVAVNCAAIPRDLFESELFGHVRGAFSGATLEKPGLVEQADGGTLLLDEIGDMPLEMQAKLLRVADDGRVRRLGDVRERHVTVKFVAATNRPLEAGIAAGSFRADLFHRLAVHHLHVKPLRERPGDVELLARLLLEQEGLAARVDLTPELLDDLAARAWPGNVRELRNFLLRRASGGRDATRREPAPAASARSLRTTRREHERRAIESTLAAAGGNVSDAARSLHLHVTTLRRKMHALGIERPA